MKKQFQNEADIVGLITRVLDQVTALDRKVEILMGRSAPQQVRPSITSTPQPPRSNYAQGGGRHNDHKARPMYRATCADCKKECEIPFRPSGDRPVYCKECFSQRKNGGIFQVNSGNKPSVTPSVPAIANTTVNIPETPRREKNKFSAAKRSFGKKKVVSKKKRK